MSSLALFGGWLLTPAPAHASPITFTASGEIQRFATHYRSDPNGSTVGAAPEIENAFPMGAWINASLTHDPELVSGSSAIGSNTAIYYDTVTAFEAEVTGHTLTTGPGDPTAYYDFVNVNILGTQTVWASRKDVLVDGAATFEGYGVAGSVTLADDNGLALSSPDLPQSYCFAEWGRAIIQLVFDDGSEAFYSLTAYGEPDRSIDSDGDGIIDGDERQLVWTLPGLDPCDPDSDGDGLLDGFELDAGTSPVDPDTDGDGIDDAVDPDPLRGAVGADEMAEIVRSTALGVLDVSESEFAGPNANAQKGRRNALSNRLQAAANELDAGNLEEAHAILMDIRRLLDGEPAPPDVMEDGAEKDLLLAEVDDLIAMIEAALVS